jgi:hypothetical protein
MSGCVRIKLTRSRNWYWKLFSERLTSQYRFLPVLPTFPITGKERSVPDKIKFYAIIDDLSSRDRPAGVLRRTYFETGGRRDEAFSRDLVWKHSILLVSAERGDVKNEFIEISEDEANQIVDRIRATVTGPSDT